MSLHIDYTVFTKPWRDKPIAELGRYIRHLGFDGVELPVRPGFQVEPENVDKGLPEAARILREEGVKIGTLAGPADERTIASCAEAGVPIIRICMKLDSEAGYLAEEARIQRQFDAIVPVLDKHGVAIGLQNHCGFQVNNAMGILHMIEKYDPRHICAVLDQAHCGLNGEPPEYAIDIVWRYLKVMNLKSAYWQRTNGPDAESATWRNYWTTGRHGLAYWPRVAAELKKRNFSGDICLTAEYSDQGSVDRLIAEDIAFARSLFD